MKKIVYVFVFFFVGSGCAKLAHLDELLTLKGLSDNQDMQVRYVEKQDKKFEQLADAVKNNQMDGFPDKKAILRAFGEPIFAKQSEEKSEVWLYRYTTKLFGSQKIYLYFDASGKLIEWQHVQPDSNKSR